LQALSEPPAFSPFIFRGTLIRVLCRKSQIAIEYCYLFKNEHPEAHIFWIFAGNTVRFEQGYQEIARRLLLRGWEDQKVDTLKLVYEWLSDEYNGEWLMVLDNADDAATFFGNRSAGAVQERGILESLARYLPQSSKGSILVTTRDKRVGERLADREKPIEVFPMNASDSMQLLRSRIAEDDWSDVDAMRLIEELAFLPLAITQAAAFISENSLTVSEYLELLDTGDADLKDLLSEHLEDPRRDLDTENSVMRTWKLSFDQISKGKPRAAQILSLMAVLDHGGAPRVLLRKDGETEIAFRTALGALQAFSLITGGKGKDAAYKMHRLVALSTQKWLELTGALRYWQTEALKVLSENFPGRQSYENWAVLEALTPHAQLVFSFTFSTAMDLLQCAKLLDFAALYDLGKGKYGEAHEKCVKSLEIRESILPLDHALTLESAQTLGETLLHRGELLSAKAMLERAVTGRERVLGELHPDTLESVSDLTITLLELDDIAAAEETSLRALEGRRQVLGDEHPDTLVSLNILSMLKQRKGDLVVAREMCEKTLQGREKILGRAHPDTLMTLNNLAVLQYRQGDLDTAKETFQTVLAGEAKLLGEECYDIQVTLSNMALVYREQGELDKAEEMHRKVLRMRERLLGPDHPATLFSVKNVADVLTQKGDLNAAEKMNQRAKKSENNNGSESAGALLRAGLLFD
jgi:tetratricopeptide (TPR) repeat protein